MEMEGPITITFKEMPLLLPVLQLQTGEARPELQILRGLLIPLVGAFVVLVEEIIGSLYFIQNYYEYCISSKFSGAHEEINLR